MSTPTEKEIIDLKDKNATHLYANNQLNALFFGFHGLSQDYSYHIENTWGGHRIDELRDNTIYRLFSSLFHCELLLREHSLIEQRLSSILANQPDQILKEIYPKNPHYDVAERQVSAIFDSIVFHVASIFDYMAILITFISLKNRDQTLMWGPIAKYAADPSHELSQKPVSLIITLINDEFVRPLYDHRSELIHRSTDIMEHNFLLKPSTGKFTIRFICSPRIRKTFKAFGDSDKDYTVSYFAYWIVITVSNIIASLLRSLRPDIIRNPPFSRHNFDKDPHKPILLMVNSTTGKAESPSAQAWGNFEMVFPAPKNNTAKENIRVYLPALFEFIDHPQFPWDKINALFSAKLELRAILANGQTIIVESTVFDIIVAAKKEDTTAIGFLCFLNRLFYDLSGLLTDEEKKLVFSNIKGMLTTFDTRFYNYVGEIGILYNLLSTKKYRLLHIEAPLPNRKSIDFKVQDVDNSIPVLVEVYNIRLDSARIDPDPAAITKFLTDRFTGKINSKNEHLTEESEFFLVPVLWGKADDLKVYSEFFQNNQFNVKNTHEPFGWLQYNPGDGRYAHRFSRISNLFNDPPAF